MSVEYATLNIQYPIRHWDEWAREQAIREGIRRAYREAVGHEPPEPPAELRWQYADQYGYGIPKRHGGYKQPRKTDRAAFVATIAA